MLSQMSPEERQKEDQIEKLKNENKRLREDLKKFNSQLSDKLKRAQKKKAGLGDLDQATKARQIEAIDKELLNAKKQSELYQKELETIQNKNINKGSVERIYELETKLSNREVKNSKLKKEILHLKKKQDDQSKELGKIGDDGPLQIQIKQLMAEIKKVTDKIASWEEQIKKAERNKMSQIEHTKKLEQELSQLEPKYGKHVQSTRNIRLNHKSTPTPVPNSQFANKKGKESPEKDEAYQKREKEFLQLKHEHENEKNKIDLEMQVLEAEVGRLKKSLDQKQQEARLSKVKISELSRQVKFHSLVPISPIKAEPKDVKGLDDQIKNMKRLQQRKESHSIGPKKRSNKIRDVSALPAYNRESSTNNIVDVSKSRDVHRSFSRQAHEQNSISKHSFTKRSIQNDDESVKELPLGDDDYGMKSKASEKIFEQGHMGSKEDPIPQKLTKA